MDFADYVNETMEQFDKQIHSYRFEMKPFIAGECRECGEFTKRLIGVLCVQCLDDLRRERKWKR